MLQMAILQPKLAILDETHGCTRGGIYMKACSTGNAECNMTAAALECFNMSRKSHRLDQYQKISKECFAMFEPTMT